MQIVQDFWIDKANRFFSKPIKDFTAVDTNLFYRLPRIHRFSEPTLTYWRTTSVHRGLDISEFSIEDLLDESNEETKWFRLLTELAKDPDKAQGFRCAIYNDKSDDGDDICLMFEKEDLLKPEQLYKNIEKIKIYKEEQIEIGAWHKYIDGYDGSEEMKKDFCEFVLKSQTT